VRESPALKIISLLTNAGADVSFHDPHVARVDDLTSVPYEPAAYDCVVIVTDHSDIDYDALVDEAKLIVDLRNATGAKGTAAAHVYKL
jgi:UDP-N-acetyl-D-glucosamine dehydrogenase